MSTRQQALEYLTSTLTSGISGVKVYDGHVPQNTNSLDSPVIVVTLDPTRSRERVNADGTIALSELVFAIEVIANSSSAAPLDTLDDAITTLLHWQSDSGHHILRIERVGPLDGDQPWEGIAPRRIGGLYRVLIQPSTITTPIETDGTITLDSTTYHLKPGSYRMERLRVRKSTVRADGNESYIDLGPGKRLWMFSLLANSTSLTGIPDATERTSLRTSYEKVATTLAFIDQQGDSYTVHFDDLRESIPDFRAAQSLIHYELAVTLREA